jgi:hypothetical protein
MYVGMWASITNSSSQWLELTTHAKFCRPSIPGSGARNHFTIFQRSTKNFQIITPSAHRLFCFMVCQDPTIPRNMGRHGFLNSFITCRPKPLEPHATV